MYSQTNDLKNLCNVRYNALLKVQNPRFTNNYRNAKHNNLRRPLYRKYCFPLTSNIPKLINNSYSC